MADEVTPFPKSVQLARGERRYRRKVASPKTWARLWDEKDGPCRICGYDESTKPHGYGTRMQLHHIVTREDFGDDVADNLAPLCEDCHRGVHLREPAHCRLLLGRLLDAEYAYMVGKGGEDYAEREE